jgi:hypothetical protein
MGNIYSNDIDNKILQTDVATNMIIDVTKNTYDEDNKILQTDVDTEKNMIIDESNNQEINYKINYSKYKKKYLKEKQLYINKK